MTRPRRAGPAGPAGPAGAALQVALLALLVVATAALPLDATPRGLASLASASTSREPTAATASAASATTTKKMTTIIAATTQDADSQTTKQTTAADATTMTAAPAATTSAHAEPTSDPASATRADATAAVDAASATTASAWTKPVAADQLKDGMTKADGAAKSVTDAPKTARRTTDRPAATETTTDELGTPSAKADAASQKATELTAPAASTEAATASDTVNSATATSDAATSVTVTSDAATSATAAADTASASTTGSLLEIEVEESTETGALNIDLRHPDDSAAASPTPAPSTTTPPPPHHHEDDETGGVLPDDDVQQNEVLDEDVYRTKHNGPWLIGSRLAGQDDGEASLASSSTSSLSAPNLGLYRNYDVDSQERERELEERAREQNHPADLEDINVHEINHYVPEQDEPEDPEQKLQQQKSVARWYLLLLTGNATTVRLRQKDFAKYLKLNLAARLSVEYNDLRVNRVEYKPLLMVNVTIFSRPKDNEEAPLHMLADTNATLLELSGEEYHVLRFITIPSEHQEALAALASGGIQADSYTGTNTLPPRHVDVGVAVYFAIAAGLVSILLAVFLVGLCRYLRAMLAEVAWPWRRYKPIVWSLPLQHRLCADHIAHCVPMRAAHQPAVWTTADGAQDIPVQKIPAPELPRRLVLEPRPGAAMPPILCADPAPSTADTLLQAQPAPVLAAVHACSRPNSKLSLFGDQQVVVAPARAAARPACQAGANRLQPQGRHPLDVRIGRQARQARHGPTVLGLDNPNYMMQ